jgi:hypothetical protein
MVAVVAMMVVMVMKELSVSCDSLVYAMTTGTAQHMIPTSSSPIILNQTTNKDHNP